MSTRTVRLDDEAEQTLDRLRRLTGLSISEVLKRGLHAYEIEALNLANRKPYDIYAQLDLGEGGYAVAPARQAKSAVAGGLQIFFLDDSSLARAFELMVQYADRPTDLADASLVVLAEMHRLRRVFTIDRNDFQTYRIRQGHSYLSFETLG